MWEISAPEPQVKLITPPQQPPQKVERLKLKRWKALSNRILKA